MIEIGRVESGIDVGLADRGKYIYSACPDCGTTKWTPLYRYNLGKYLRCRKCAAIFSSHYGSDHHNWKGGFTRNDGYVVIRISPDDSYYNMSYNGSIFEHRYVVAKSLGRCLNDREIVHHLNGIRNDNRLDNLVVVIKGDHEYQTLLKLAQTRILELERLTK